jgi:hypothetical protein
LGGSERGCTTCLLCELRSKESPERRC